jgi:chromosome segregation protein
MKLKSISVQGFKTLADRVNLQFHDGITGIIGPNGTGKSNIIAAVRWVLGEQSAKNLRDPEEVIFAGSDARKQMSMAEVVLTFSNDGIQCPPEFMHMPEISIGRRVFRDGKREYFMNKEACRLKDIVDFLLSIGIGARGYSIIEQEKRDRIISATPAGMRDILEETAGITIFKQHRNDAERRLQSTNEKLTSLVEIENELKTRCEQLQIQVEKAAEKKSKSEALRERQIAELCFRTGHFRSLAKKFRDEIEKLSKEIEDGVIASAGWEARANELQAEHMEMTQEIKTLEDTLDERRIALAQYKERRENQRKNSEERLKRRESLTNNLKVEQENLVREENRMRQCTEDMEKVERELREIDSTLETLQERFDEVDENMRVERGRGEEIQSEIRATQELMTTLRNRNESILERIHRANEGLRRNNDLLAEAKRTRGNFVADRDSQKAQLALISSGMQEIADQKSLFEQELKTAKQQFEEAERARDGAKDEFGSVTSALAGLQQVQNANEGLSDGARELRTRLANVLRGFFFEHVSVSPEDERVLEMALPELLQSAFVDDSEALMDILDKVEELDLTRVGFLVRDFVSPLSEEEEAARERVLKVSGLRNVGQRLRACSKPEAGHILSRIFIARDEWLVQKAMREAGGAGAGFTFVSERGVLLSAGREIAFGRLASGDATGLLQRKRQIAELEEKRTEAQRALAAAQGVLYESGEKRKALEAKLAEIEARISREQLEVLKFTTAIETISVKVAGIEENIGRIESENAQAEQEIAFEQERFAGHQSQLDKCDSDLREFQLQYDEWMGEQTEKKELRDTLNSQLQEKRTARLICAERGSTSRRNYEEISYQLQRVQQSVDRVITELSAISNQIETSEDDQSSLVREIESLQAEIAKGDMELSEYQEREANTAEQLRVISNKLRNKRDADSAQMNAINEKKIEMARCTTIVEQTEIEANERFLLLPQDLPNEVPAGSPSEEKLKREISRLQAEIEELGAVNERALEEFHECSERLGMLDSQRADIVQSMGELSQAINQIEDTTKTRFKEIFDKVNLQFQSLFPILFPGGEARLNLENPNDMLTTGVEIYARLPGKKMQRMHLYSGGEKALTAISLIFALLKTHPAPFCFLDEVDAPLDEANVGRFNAVLEMLSEQFQFVVITHNRRTMEVLDRIYGISMQEAGISKLVSVDLSDVPEHLVKKKGASANQASSSARAGAAVESLIPAQHQQQTLF